MKNTALVVLCAAIVVGCAGSAPKTPIPIDDRITAELTRASEERKPAPSDGRVQDALLPPLRMDLPRVASSPIDPKFDLAVNNAPAAQVFLSIVSGTRYSMLVPAEVAGSITVNLKDVTVLEALDALRELYGYEYKLDGTRIFIQPLTLRTRVFPVNYLVGQRLGRSDVRVTSGSVGDTAAASGAIGVPGVAGTTGMPTTGVPPGQVPGTAAVTDSSRIQTTVRSDFWEDLRQTLTQIVGNQAGRNVVVNPQASLAVVRAMPSELRDVENYLRAIRLSVERQVMLNRPAGQGVDCGCVAEGFFHHPAGDAGHLGLAVDGRPVVFQYVEGVRQGELDAGGFDQVERGSVDAQHVGVGEDIEGQAGVGNGLDHVFLR